MDLYHDAMPFLEGVQHILQPEIHITDFPGHKRFGGFKSISESPPEDFGSDQLLIPTHNDVIRVVLVIRMVRRVDVYQFDDEVGVGRSHGYFEPGHDFPCDGFIILQGLG